MSSDPHALQRLKIDRTKAPPKKSPWPVLALVLLLLGGGGYAVLHWVKRPQPVAIHTTTVATPKSGTASVLLNASGYVTARRAATVSSKVTGKVIEVTTEEGQRVEKDQILAYLDATNLTASLKLAEAQLAAQKAAEQETLASLSLAETELQRATKLQANNVIAESEMDRAQTDARSLRARLIRQKAEIAVAERQVAVWQQQLDDTIIRAPFAGVVTSKNAQPGEMISPMSAGGFTRTGICTLVDMTSLEVEVDVNESYIQRVEAGQPATAVLDSYPDWKIPCKVIAIIPTADRQKASVKVRVGFEQLDPRILPDMGVKVAFEGTAKNAPETPAVTIPAGALRSRNGRDIVFLKSGEQAEERAISVLSRNGDSLLIGAGLRGGETLIIDPPAELADGALIIESKS